MGLLSKAADWLSHIGHQSPNGGDTMPGLKAEDRPEPVKSPEYTPDMFRFEDYDPYARINPAEASSATDLRPSGVTASSLRLLHFRSTLLSSIITRRVGQLSHFGVPQTKIEQGFHIVPRDWKDGKPLKGETLERCQELEAYISNLGILEGRLPSENFYEFLKQATIDSLLLDAVCFERIFSRSGKLVAFKLVDAAAIQPVYSETDKAFVYQEISLSTGTFVNTYTPREMAYVCRNRTSDRRWAGFGQSEAERLIGPLTSHLYAMEYNKRILKNGHNTSGLISLKGNISRQQFAEFKRDMYAYIRGVENTGNAAIVNAPQGVEVLQGIKSPDEIGFSELMNLLVRQCCSMYNMDPEELHWLFSESGQSAKRELSNEEFRIQYSRDQGLRLLLSFFERLVNEEILKYVDPDYVFEFTGMNPQTNADKISNTVSAMQFMTINEARELMKLPKVKDKQIGDMICNQMANAIYAQKIQQEAMEAQNAAAMGGGQVIGPDGQPMGDAGAVMGGQPADGDPNQQVLGAGKGTPAQPTGDQSKVVMEYLQQKGYPDETIEHVMQLYNQGGMTFEEIQEVAEQNSPDEDGGYGGTPEDTEEPGNDDISKPAEEGNDEEGPQLDERGNALEADPLGLSTSGEGEPQADTETETPAESEAGNAPAAGDREPTNKDEMIDTIGRTIGLTDDQISTVHDAVNAGEMSYTDFKEAAQDAVDSAYDTDADSDGEEGTGDRAKVLKLAQFLQLSEEQTDTVLAAFDAGEVTLEELYNMAKQ